MTFSHVSLGVKHRALGDKRTVCRANAQPSTRLAKTLLSVALMSAMALMSVEAAEVIDDRHAEAVDYGTALTSINAPDGYWLKVNSLSIPSFSIQGTPVTVELGSGGLTVRDNYSLVAQGRKLQFVGTGANAASLNGGKSINVKGGTLNFSQMGDIAWQGAYWVHNAGHSTITDTTGFAGDGLFVEEGADLTLNRVNNVAITSQLRVNGSSLRVENGGQFLSSGNTQQFLEGATLQLTTLDAATFTKPLEVKGRSALTLDDVKAVQFDQLTLTDHARFTATRMDSLTITKPLQLTESTVDLSNGVMTFQDSVWALNGGNFAVHHATEANFNATVTVYPQGQFTVDHSDKVTFQGDWLWTQGGPVTFTHLKEAEIASPLYIAQGGTVSFDHIGTLTVDETIHLTNGSLNVSDVGSFVQDRAFYKGDVRVDNVESLTFTAPQIIMGSGNDSHHWLNMGSVTFDMAPQPLSNFPTFLTGFYASNADNRIQTGAFTSDVRYQTSSCGGVCTFEAIQSYSSLFSIGQLQIDVSGDTVIRSNSDVPLPLVSGTGFGQANGLTRIGERSVALMRVGMVADGTPGELTLNTEGTNTFAFYDLETNLTPQEPQGFLIAHLYAYRGRLAVTGAANTFAFDYQRDVSPDGVVNLATWWGFSTAVNSFLGGDVAVTATQGDNTIVIDKPASYVRGVSVSPYNAEAWVSLVAPQGMNRIVLAPIFPETVNRSEDNLLGDTTGVYAALYGRVSDVPETLTWDRPHLLLDALENAVTLRTTSRYGYGVSAANGAYAELLARSGDNTVDMAPRELITGYQHFGLYANGTARVSENAPLGENRVTVTTHCTGNEGPLQGLTRGVMVFDKGEAYLTAKGNRVTVESSLEPNVTDLTAGVAIHDEGTVHLRATETGNTVTVKAKDGVGISIEPTSTGERSRAEITLDALGDGNNTVEATRALLVRLGSVTMTTEAGENRIVGERDAIVIEPYYLPDTGRVTIEGKQTIVAKTGRAINAQPTAEEWFDIQLHYAQDSHIQGDILAQNGVATTIRPRNEAEPGTMMLDGNATFFNGARLDLTLTPGSHWSGNANDYTALGVTNQVAGSIALTMQDNTLWHFTGMSMLKSVSGRGGTIAFGTREDQLGKALYIDQLTGSQRFAMTLNKDASRSDMLYINEASDDAQTLVLNNAAEFTASMNFGDAVRFATIRQARDPFRSGTVMGKVVRGLYVGEITIESRDVTTDPLNTEANNQAIDGDADAIAAQAKLGPNAGERYRMATLDTVAEAARERSQATSERRVRRVRRAALAATAESTPTAETSVEANDSPQNIYLVLNRTEELSDVARGNEQAAAASWHVATLIDTFTKRAGQMQYMERYPEKDVWARATYHRSTYDDAGRLQGGIFEFGHRREVDHTMTHEHNDRHYRSFALGYGEFHEKMADLSGKSTIQDFHGAVYDTFERRPGLDELERLEPWERDQYWWRDSYAKLHYVRSDIRETERLTGEVNQGHYHRWSANLSTEYGFKKPLSETWSFLPQAQLQFTWLGEAQWTDTHGNRTFVDNTWSLIGRVGFDVAREWGDAKEKRFYAKASLLHEFNSHANLTMESGGGAVVPAYRSSLDTRGTWGVIGLGYTHKIKRDRVFFADVERTVGSGLSNQWSVRAGYTWSWK